MLLILLRDGSYVEIANADDVIHRPGVLVCVDEAATPLITFAADEVLAYTARQDIAQRMLDDEPNGTAHRRSAQKDAGLRTERRRHRRF